LRTAAHPKKPERPRHHMNMAGTRGLDLNSFAQLPRQSAAAAQLAIPQQVETAPSQPAGEVAGPLFAADGGAAEQRADAGSGATEFPETMPMPVADPIGAPQQPITSGQIAAGPAPRLPASLVLALCALLAFGCWGWIRSRTDEAASAFR
jgi:hypothetical protein